MTRVPSEVWVTQQLRNVTPYGHGPRFLLRDHDAKFGKLFDRAAIGIGARVIRTPVRAPKANAICGDLPANTNSRIVKMPVLGGLHHVYRWAA